MPSHSYWLLMLFGLTAVICAVNAQLVYINDPENQTICIGDTAVMDCGYKSSSGVVPLLLAVINGTALAANNSDVPPFIIKSNPNETNASQVIIGPVEKQFAGIITFSCQLALNPPINGLTATLNVVVKPSAPTITVDNVELYNFTISWTVTPDVNVTCGPPMYNVTLDNGVTYTTSLTSYTFSGLSNETDYTVVVASFYYGRPEAPANITVTTLTPSVPFPPTNVQLNLKFVDGDVNISATWMAPQLLSNMTEIQNYSLTLTVRSISFTATIPANSIPVDIFDVFPNVNRSAFTPYSLSVAAVNSVGPSNPTNNILVVSNYTTDVSVTEDLERIIVRCSVAQSEPALLCRAVFYCGNNEIATLNLSSNAAQNFTTHQPCHVTIQVVSPNNISQVLEETFFNISPSIRPTSPSSPDRDSSTSDDNDISVVGIVVGNIVIIAIVIVIVTIVLILFYYRRYKNKKFSPVHRNTASNKSMKELKVDSRDKESPRSMDPNTPLYSTVQVTSHTKNRKKGQVKPAVVSQCSQITITDETALYSEVCNPKKETALYSEVYNPKKETALYSEVYNPKKETALYSEVYNPKKAKGKVNNYTNIASLDPFPSKRARDAAQYNGVSPNASQSHEHANTYVHTRVDK